MRFLSSSFFFSLIKSIDRRRNRTSLLFLPLPHSRMATTRPILSATNSNGNRQQSVDDTLPLKCLIETSQLVDGHGVRRSFELRKTLSFRFRLGLFDSSDTNVERSVFVLVNHKTISGIFRIEQHIKRFWIWFWITKKEILRQHRSNVYGWTSTRTSSVFRRFSQTNWFVEFDCHSTIFRSRTTFDKLFRFERILIEKEKREKSFRIGVATRFDVYSFDEQHVSKRRRIHRFGFVEKAKKDVKIYRRFFRLEKQQNVFFSNENRNE